MRCSVRLVVMRCGMSQTWKPPIVAAVAVPAPPVPAVVPVGQAVPATSVPTAGTAVQRAPLPPNSAEVELQVQPWKLVSLGPLTAPT